MLYQIALHKSPYVQLNQTGAIFVLQYAAQSWPFLLPESSRERIYCRGHCASNKRGTMVQHLAQTCVIDTEGVSWIKLSGRLKNVTKICPKTCISTDLMLRDITFFVTLPGLFNNRSKERTKWSDSNMSGTVRSGTSLARFAISQSKVWPRRWVGALTNCSKLRLQRTSSSSSSKYFIISSEKFTRGATV